MIDNTNTKKEPMDELRKIFQNTSSRQRLLSLMIDEIRLNKMKEQQKNISYIKAAEELEQEFKDVKDSILYKERVEIVGSFMKDMGF